MSSVKGLKQRLEAYLTKHIPGIEALTIERLEQIHGGHETSADPSPAIIDSRNRHQQSSGSKSRPGRNRWHKCCDIRRRTHSQCSRQPRVHHRKRHPPIEKCQPLSVEPTQVNVTTTGFRQRDRELGITQCAGARHQCHCKPHRCQQRRRPQRLRHRCRCQKNSKRYRFAGNHGDRRRQSEFTFQRHVWERAPRRKDAGLPLTRSSLERQVGRPEVHRIRRFPRQSSPASRTNSSACKDRLDRLPSSKDLPSLHRAPAHSEIPNS